MFTYNVNCPYCNLDVRVDVSDDICDQYTQDRENDQETIYEIDSEGNFCPICHQKFDVFGTIVEYPEGSYNSHDLNTKESVE